MEQENTFYATGRRKTAIARTWIKPGSGEIVINNRPVKEYFPIETIRTDMIQPFKITNTFGSYDVKATVVGGGIAGMNAALNLAKQGFESTVIEKAPELGGMARKLHHTIEGADIRTYLDQLIATVGSEKKIEVLTDARVTGFEGFQGNFVTEVAVGSGNGTRKIDHGVIIVATGG